MKQGNNIVDLTRKDHILDDVMKKRKNTVGHRKNHQICAGIVNTARVMAALLACVSLILAGCETKNGAEGESSSVLNPVSSSNDSSSDSSSAVSIAIDAADMFTDRDLEGFYEESSSAIITLTGDSASCSSNAVTVSGSTVMIADEGTYIISGTLEDGQIIVNADGTDKVQLVLNGVDITSATSAAIYVLEADKVFITLAEGSENTLVNGGEYVDIDDSSIDAVIFSKQDLTFNGSGSLSVTANAGHGIVGKDDVKFAGGAYDITAASHGICANDSIRIASGSFTVKAGKDGMQAENSDDSSLGYIYIASGTFRIEAEGDGINAGPLLRIDGGEFDLKTGGGSSGGISLAYSASYSYSTDESQKGLKASGDILLNDGTFTIDSYDDGIHSNAGIEINGGTYKITTGDDGAHADGSLTVNAGTISVAKSYEGLEGLTITVNGGDISVVSSDDGFNAAGGNDASGFGARQDRFSTSSSSAYLEINGGNVSVDASGDGLDSNGNLMITGGTIYVSGPTNSGNGALDCGDNATATITGGTIIAAGASGMAETFGSSSTQCSILLNFTTQSAGTTIEIEDSDGNVLLSWESEKSYSSVVISCPELSVGSTYTVTAGSYSEEVTLSSTVYSSGGGMGGGMGGNPGGGMGGGGMGGRR